MTPQHRHRWFILMMFMLAHAVNDGFGWIIPPLLPAIREPGSPRTDIRHPGGRAPMVVGGYASGKLEFQLRSPCMDFRRKRDWEINLSSPGGDHVVEDLWERLLRSRHGVAPERQLCRHGSRSLSG